PGPAGLWPLDAALRVPVCGSAARWREGAASGTTAASSRARQTVRERLLGLSLRLPARATSRGAAARAVPPFSDQPPTRPPPVTGGPIRGGQGEGLAGARRPPRRGRAPPARDRRGARRAARSVPPPVARPEGAEARPQQVLRPVPPPTLGWESLHATAYRWDTAHALLGDPHPGRTTGVRTPRAPGRAGPTDTVRTARVVEAHAPRRPETPRRAVLRTGGSDHRNRPSLPDDAS